MNRVVKTVLNSIVVFAMVLAACISSIQEILANNWEAAFYFDGNEMVYLYSLKEAWQYAIDHDVTVYFNKDFYVNEYLDLGENHSATIDMNGYCMYFDDPPSSAVSTFGFEDGYFFNVGKNSTLTLIGSRYTNFEYDGFNPKSSSGEIMYNQKYFMNVYAGGLLTNTNSYNKAGAIYLEEGATLYIENIAICGNLCKDRSTVSASSQGVIRLAGDNAKVYMKNTQITNNSGNIAGMIGVNGDNCRIEMEDSHVDYNSVYNASRTKDIKGGAGLYVTGDNLTLKMTRSSMNYNRTSNKEGGGILAKDSINIEMYDHSSINNNIAADGDGGGIYADDKLTIKGDGTSTISNNSSSNDGGGILINNDDCYISNVTISGNHADRGAGIYIDDEDSTIENCTITNNEASGNGGGIYDDNDGNVIKNCTITGNKTTSGEGGGVYVYGTVDVELRGKNNITENKKGDSNNNVYLDNWGLSKAYITGSVDAGSLVGISSSSSSTRQVGDELYNYIDGTFLLDSNQNKYHLEYVSSDHELFIREGETKKYTVYVNNKELGKYYYRDTVVISDNNTDSEKIFIEWDKNNSTGYKITDSQKSSKTFTIDKMPQNNVYIEAYYAKKLTGLTLKLDKPVGGSSLPNSLLSMTNTTNDSIYRTDKYEWLEVNEDGTTTPTSGTAKYNTNYAIKIQMQQDLDKRLAFSENLRAEDVKIQYGDVTVQAKEVSVDANGTVTIISQPVKTDNKTVKSFESVSITVNEGISKSDLIDLLPTKAVGTDTKNSRDTYSVDTTKIEDLIPESLIHEDSVVIPEGGSVTITLPIEAQEGVIFDAEFNVTIKVVDKETTVVATPTLQYGSGLYTGTSLQDTASTTTDGATIYYTIGNGEKTEYNSETGISLSTEADTIGSFLVNIWAEKDGNVSNTLHLWYILDARSEKKVTINCFDTAKVEGEKTAFDTKEYRYAYNTRVTITAPTFDGEVFDKWEYSDGTTSTDSSITYDKLTADQTVKAIYNPVISEINFDIDYPIASFSLPTLEENSITAKIGNNTELTTITDYFDLANASWLPTPKEDSKGNKVADYDTSYTLKLPIKANQSEDVKYVLANNIKVTVKGKTDVVVSVDEDNLVAYLTFPKTSSETYDLNRIISPESISVSYLDAYNAAIKQEKEDQKEISGDEKHDNKWTMLPKSVQLELDTTSKYQIDADVEWSIPNFDKTSLKAQTLTITGTVKIPSYVTNTKQISNEVTLTVNVEDPLQVDAPSSSVKTGTYKKTQYVALSSIEDASIYYTLDGSEPTISSTLYEEAIKLTNTTTIKAIAVKAGMIDSEVSTFVITIDSSVPTASPTSTPEAKKSSTKKSSGWDDGGPFTTDSCGNVYDRWGNKIYEATSCNVGGYNLVPTDTAN